MKINSFFFIPISLLLCYCNNNVANTDTASHSIDSVNKKQDDTLDNQSTNAKQFKSNDLFSISINNRYLFLQQWISEDELLNILGKWQKKHTDTLKNADTFTGSVVKIYSYNNLGLKTFLPRGKTQPGWIMEMTINTPVYQTADGLGVNDRVEKMKKVYPMVRIAEDGRSKENNGRYIINNSDDTKFIEFTVANGSIKQLRLFYQLP